MQYVCNNRKLKMVIQKEYLIVLCFAIWVNSVVIWLAHIVPIAMFCGRIQADTHTMFSLIQLFSILAGFFHFGETKNDVLYKRPIPQIIFLSIYAVATAVTLITMKDLPTCHDGGIIAYSVIFIAIAVICWIVLALLSLHTYRNYKHEYVAAPSPMESDFLEDDASIPPFAYRVTTTANPVVPPLRVQTHVPPAAAPELATPQAIPPELATPQATAPELATLGVRPLITPATTPELATPQANAPELATLGVLPPISRTSPMPDCEPPPYDQHMLYDSVEPSKYYGNKYDETHQH